jgi:hypothetical protein
MLLVDPSELLPEHRKLLERDFLSLGEGSLVDGQYWLAQMHTAVAAAEIEKTGSKRPQEDTGGFSSCMESHTVEPLRLA